MLDRKTGVFYSINFEDRKWGGYSLEDYCTLARQHNLAALAQALLGRRHRAATWAKQ